MVNLKIRGLEVAINTGLLGFFFSNEMSPWLNKESGKPFFRQGIL